MSGKEPQMSIFEIISRWISGGEASGNTGQADTGDSWLSKVDPRFLPPPEGFDYGDDGSGSTDSGSSGDAGIGADIEEGIPRRLPPLAMLVIADLHACTYRTLSELQDIMKTEAYDCVLFLGDIFQEDIERLVPHADGRPCFYVLGNHDREGQNTGIEGLEDLDGRTAEVCGVRISGASGSVRYKPGDFCMRSEDEVQEALDRTGRTDILISHEAPWHFLEADSTHRGYKAITRFIEREEPAMHIFGHYHTREDRIRGNTREICVYRCCLISTMPYSNRGIL